MDFTRLRLLVELDRLGTMVAVSEVTGMSTSAVSKHFAVLEKEARVPLIVPDGRRVRLTPAGRRLAEHAVDILARVEQAQAEFDGEGEPVGRVDLVMYTSAAPVVLPALRRLREDHPGIDIRLTEHESDQALTLLQDGGADLGIVYQYSILPRDFPGTLSVHPVGTEGLLLAQPSADGDSRTLTRRKLREFSDASWIASPFRGDEEALIRRMCADAGFIPRIAHRIDNLRLFEDLVAARSGVGVVPRLTAETRRGVAHAPLGEVGGARQVYLAGRTGTWAWRPIRLVARYLHESATGILDDVPPLDLE
ncbi:DNA-binding transcriptional LysR family regulator [Nocardiopsis sp. Huas11]|uniref:LysR family transcriptional regulator n=1 Tax=Nocardiopsis sp. Huas11 TaxID=2183912 RepID=UPI000EB3976F|nr:LysR family transcriptional regulator [Nocardiopsis sp. Huas11]RKS08320.1 DNA-binding transcriptional LysR family regulator [Nocardiopsis sp. Huas11]